MACELVAARDRVDVLVAQEVDLFAGLLQPREEREVPVVEAERQAEVEERPRQVDGAVAPADVPGVAPAVAVRVGEVVGLPRLRREHDRDALPAEQRAAARSAARTRRARRRRRCGGSRARSASRPARTNWIDAGAFAMRAPVDARGRGHRLPARAEVAHRGERTAAVREHLERQRRRIRRDGDRRRLARRVARLREPRLDPLHAHDRRMRARARARRRRTRALRPAALTVSWSTYVRGAMPRRGVQTSSCAPGAKARGRSLWTTFAALASGSLFAVSVWITVRATRAAAARRNWTCAASRKPSPFGLTVVRSGPSPRKGVDPFVTRRPRSCGAAGFAAAGAAAPRTRTSASGATRRIRGRVSPVTEPLRTPESRETTEADTLGAMRRLALISAACRGSRRPCGHARRALWRRATARSSCKNGAAPDGVPVVPLTITGSVIGRVTDFGKIVIDQARIPTPARR